MLYILNDRCFQSVRPGLLKGPDLPPTLLSPERRDTGAEPLGGDAPMYGAVLVRAVVGGADVVFG